MSVITINFTIIMHVCTLWCGSKDLACSVRVPQFEPGVGIVSFFLLDLLLILELKFLLWVKLGCGRFGCQYYSIFALYIHVCCLLCGHCMSLATLCAAFRTFFST